MAKKTAGVRWHGAGSKGEDSTAEIRQEETVARNSEPGGVLKAAKMSPANQLVFLKATNQNIKRLSLKYVGCYSFMLFFGS